jgi:hypothetical protein
MTYDQRINQITFWFRDEISTRFNMPNGLDPKVLVNDIVEAINSNLPSRLTQEQMGNILAHIAKDVTRAAKTRTLPLPASFVEAAKSATEGHRTSSATTLAETPSMTPEQAAAARIRKGLPLSARWLVGERRQRLIEQCGLTEDELRPYDLYIAAHMQ